MFFGQECLYNFKGLVPSFMLLLWGGTNSFYVIFFGKTNANLGALVYTRKKNFEHFWIRLWLCLISKILRLWLYENHLEMRLSLYIRSSGYGQLKSVVM